MLRETMMSLTIVLKVINFRFINFLFSLFSFLFFIILLSNITYDLHVLFIILLIRYYLRLTTFLTRNFLKFDEMSKLTK